MFLLRVIILLVGVHCYIFLSALIYHYLERPGQLETVNHLEQVVETHFVPSRPKKSKQEIVDEIKTAFEKDDQVEKQRAFKSLWKCYLFSLTTITTLGNSGLYLQSDGSRLFFIFTTAIGIVLYVSLVHHIGIILFTIFKDSVEFSIKQRFDERHFIQYKSFSRLAILLFSYLITFISLLVIGLGAVMSGHGYLFGLYVVFDSAFAVGNFSILTYVYPWNEIGFALSVNLIILMSLSVMYTSVYLTFQYARGSDFDELIKYWWNSEDTGHDYKMISQDEERPFKKFMSQSKPEATKANKKIESDKAPLIMKNDEYDGNPFLSDDDDDGEQECGTDSISGKGPDSLTPAFLSTVSENGERSNGLVKEAESGTTEVPRDSQH
ncbi:uncharacterized protein LOC135696667 [Rhopilema esculentum]|uniref:uncharacterized protein LOC135696667 n=1 Tax=Rhopilema esculentum TaxID=499914 RepID=UPI0031D1E8FB|eukprot:gene12903-3656_t